jgi:cell division protein FtsB
MPLLKKINIKIVLVVLVVFMGTMFLLFNDFGILKFLKLKKEVSTLNEEIKNATEEIKVLKNQNDSLERKVPAKIEKSAREKYGMIRKGEKAIEIITK